MRIVACIKQQFNKPGMSLYAACQIHLIQFTCSRICARYYRVCDIIYTRFYWICHSADQNKTRVWMRVKTCTFFIYVYCGRVALLSCYYQCLSASGYTVRSDIMRAYGEFVFRRTNDVCRLLAFPSFFLWHIHICFLSTRTCLMSLVHRHQLTQIRHEK